MNTPSNLIQFTFNVEQPKQNDSHDPAAFKNTKQTLKNLIGHLKESLSICGLESTDNVFYLPARFKDTADQLVSWARNAFNEAGFKIDARVDSCSAIHISLVLQTLIPGIAARHERILKKTAQFVHRKLPKRIEEELKSILVIANELSPDLVDSIEQVLYDHSAEAVLQYELARSNEMTDPLFLSPQSYLVQPPHMKSAQPRKMVQGELFPNFKSVQIPQPAEISHT